MIIKENNIFYEMVTIKRDIQNNKCITVNPDSNKEGNPYFKYYNHQSYNSATAVIRILFKEPGFVIHKNYDGKDFWNISVSDKKILMKILMSPYSANKNYTIWDYAKYQWNYEYLEVDIDFEDYVNGEYDDFYKDNPSYVSSKEQIKNYNQTLYLVGKGDIDFV